MEKYSVIRSMRAIERADVALLMIDAVTGISAQDAHIAGYVLEAQKSTVVLVNKWDAVEKDNETMQLYTEQIRRDLKFIAYVPILFISVKSGQRVDQVMPLALKVQEERLARLTTGQLNRILQEAQDAHAATSSSGRSLRIYYGMQVRSDPPLLCSTAMTQNWRTSLMCVTWKIRFAKSIHFRARLSGWCSRHGVRIG